jgi:phage-related protein
LQFAQIPRNALTQGVETPKREIDLIRERLKEAELQAKKGQR